MSPNVATGDPTTAIAIVGLGAVLPDALSAPAFWQNIASKRYSIIETPPERWSIADYYDPDPSVPDKTYSKIGGWVRDFQFDWKRFRVPPKVAEAMDEGQQWAVTIAAEALADYGYPNRPLDTNRVGVILGTAMGGELHYITTSRLVFPQYARWLTSAGAFRRLEAPVREAILHEWHGQMDAALPPITEDTMPGELPNIVSGRVANVLNLRGPNFITDAACASSFAAVQAACEALVHRQVDAVIAGGVDRNMGAPIFVKFCKIGALSATGSRPFGDGADGFVMGEGSGAFLLKRLGDAERDGDRIYAVIRGVGGSSDGKGKGITAPNPLGQILAIQRAWENSGLEPATATLVEAHGTSTRVGDVAEVESLATVFGGGARPNTIALGSAKSNIGHLKAGAGAAGLLKTALALHHKQLPPTLNATTPNPNIDFAATPFYLNHDLRPWEQPGGSLPRRAGVSAYGFGGTNFHLVMEEHVPGMLPSEAKSYAGVDVPDGTNGSNGTNGSSGAQKPASTLPPGSERPSQRPLPPRGILALGAASPSALKEQLDAAYRRVESGWTPERALPPADLLRMPERLLIDFGDGAELRDRIEKARKALAFDNAQGWKMAQAAGIFRGHGPAAGKIAFLFPGQGSQYLNMGRELAALSPTVANVFAEADRVMTPILGRPLTAYIFVDGNDPAARKAAEQELMQTAITQPAMLTLDTALLLLLRDYGFTPDCVMGHSLGEYAALIAAGIMPFAHALEASAARGAEMTRVSMEDNGWMAAVMAPFAAVEQTLAEVDGYVVAANINSNNQSVIGGASKAVEQAIALFVQKGFTAVRIPVSHAFHTQIVAPASKPLRQVLDRLTINPPTLPLVANVTGGLYPTTVEGIKDILEQQIASPVQWVKGLETLYAEGMRTFVEVGPKKALKGFVDDVLADKPDVWSLFTNHPKGGELATFNHALCGLYAAGYGLDESTAEEQAAPPIPVAAPTPAPVHKEVAVVPSTPATQAAPVAPDALGQALLQMMQQFAGAQHAAARTPHDRNETPLGSVVISGTGLGLPGAGKPVMDPDNALRILHGEQFVDLIPERFRKEMANKRVTQLIKGEDGSGHFETIEDTAAVIKLAGRAGSFDLTQEYGVSSRLVEALDITTQLAMAAGLDALREAGIPLVQTYRATNKGTYLPERWLLPESLRDETGVIFASAFPGGDRFADEFRRYHTWLSRTQQVEALEDLRRYAGDLATLNEIERRLGELRHQLALEPYEFDRRFIFRVLAMGHSQFAEYIGARGPNTHVNAACASTAQGVALAEDWIRSGRCRRVLVVGADDVTSDNLMGWIGAGFLSTGAAATDDKVEEAALPFDRRRHGTLLGMGACALLVESEDAVRERGMRGIVELLSSETANSAFHGTRLDVSHIADVMNRLVTAAERRFGLNRHHMAQQMAFISHETFTPARGGSAAAEVEALRKTFGHATARIVVSNTKGFTGHPMGAGVEDVIAVKILEYGIVPPVPNYKEVDPELGTLNLSRGGRYPVQYALHLAAGFGSQIAMTLVRRIPGALDRTDNLLLYRRWLSDVAGYDRAETEVVKRVLRVVAQGAPGRSPAPSRWQYGTGPALRALAPGNGVVSEPTPQPMIMPQVAALPPLPPQPAPRPTPQPAPQPEQPRPIPEAPQAPEPQRPTTPETPAPAPSTPTPAPAGPPAPPAPVQPVGSGYSAGNGYQAVHAAAPVPAPAAQADPVESQVLALVAAKTGYPQEMLDLELDLEADLGIDTVKQAETFAAIRSEFDIPAQEGLKLRDYATLGSVVEFVYSMKPELKQAPSPAAAPVPQATQPAGQPVSQPQVDPVADRVLALIAEKTGYPQEMLDPELDLEADLGIDTVKQAETFAAIRAAFDIPAQEGLKLRDYPTLQSVIDFVYTMKPEWKQAAPAAAAPGNGTPPTPPVFEPPPSTPAAAPAPVAAAVDAVAQQVLAVVADKTGYPTEMLDLDSDLEADLGIDTVKQAETFAAIRAAFDIPVQEGLKLRDYPTLQSVIQFVYDNRPDLKPGMANGGPEAAPAAAPAQAADSVAAMVLALVADKTGYPTEMLDLDSDLEADLGVDTVKQAETFAAVRAAFDIPLQEGLKLRDYPTLQSVIDFVYAMKPELKGAGNEAQAAVAAPAEPPGPQSAVQPAPAVQSIGTLEDADRMPRRVPVPTLRPGLDLCLPTGVTLGEGSRVVVMMDQGGVGKALVSRLQKRGVTVLPFEVAPATDAMVEQLQAWLAEGPIQGVYWLPALDVEPGIEEMELAAWREQNRIRVKNLFNAMRTLYTSVAGPGRFLISATRMGGLHGYGPTGASAPLGGAVTGFTKAYHIEQSMRDEGKGLLVKAVDFESGRKTAEPADLLVAETLFDPGVVEVGHQNGLRCSVTLEEQPARDGNPGMLLDENSVFVVTGAAGGITSAIVADLAAHSRGTFYLLDLVQAPARDDEQIRLFRQGRETLKQALIARAKAGGEKVTPAAIDKQIAATERSEAALRAIESVEAAGGTAHYVSLDLRDGEAIARVIEDVRSRFGRIDVLLHAGGLLIDRTLPNKEPGQFDLVFDVKADGFFSLLKAAQGLPIGATVCFSSVAGRFGNNGQSDYSSANDLLCKISSSMRAWRPATRGIAIDWTAWGQIGMASRGSVPQIMEALGVDMLPPECGVPTIRRELTCGGTRGEVVVAGRLGAWLHEKHPTGGLDVDALHAQLAARPNPLLMVGKVTAANLFGGLQVETTLDPTQQPFLFDHQVEPGVAWLPGVMGTEALGEVASLLAPGRHVAAVEDLNILSAFKFHRDKPQTLYLSASGRPQADGTLRVRALLKSRFQPPKPDLPPTIKEHFEATLLLRPGAPETPAIEFQPPAADALPIAAERIYKVYFHGPAYQVIERAVVAGESATARMAEGLGPNANPAHAAALLAPRLVELCFQTAALWSIETKQAMALPAGIDRLEVYRKPEEANGKRLYALVTAVDGGESYDARVVDEGGCVYVALRGYRTVQMPGVVTLL